MNVLLVSVDTTRADCLGCYGHPTVKTPNIDRLAREGTRFAQCISSVPITLPSHSTMMTGSYQFVHGARDNGMFELGPENVTLAELFRERGYATHAAVASMVLNRRYGLGQGFDTYDDLQRREGSALKTAGLAGPSRKDSVAAREQADAMVLEKPEPAFPWSMFDRKADEVTRYGIGLLTENKDNPFFIFLHYFDPHQPPEAPPRFSEQYRDGYLAEIAYFDEQFGLLMDALRNLGLAEKTLVILTSDHGEGRGDHGEQTHSYFIYDSVLRVPLILSCPGMIPAGQVVESQVRLVDLAPTIVDFAWLKATSQMQGASLVPLLMDPAQNPGLPAYADTLSTRISFGYSPLRSLRCDGWKYILSPVPELYHVADDPLELFNLARTEPQRAATMREQLRRLIAESPPPPGSRLARQQVGAEELRKLQALGYLAGGAVPTDEEEGTSKTELDDFEPTGADPTDHKEAIELMNVSLGFLLSGKYGAAEATYRRLLELEPGNAKANRELADSIAAQNRLEEAEQHYRAALEMQPDDVLARRALGKVLFAGGDLAGAEDQFRQVIRLDPAEYIPHLLLGDVLVRRGRTEESFREYQIAAVSAPDVPAVLVQWAQGHRAVGQLAEAEAKLRQACAMDPELSIAHLLLAQLLGERNRPAEAGRVLLGLLEVHPDETRALEMLAEDHARAGDLEGAAEYYTRAAETDPKGPTGAFYRGLVLALVGKLDEAIVEYRLALELKPEFLRAHMKMAGALERSGRTNQAIQACRGMLEAVPRQSQAYTFAADLFDRLGKAVLAIELLRRGHSVLPQDADIANDLAWRLATSARPELRNGRDAIELAERARELTNGNSANVLDTLAAAYAEVGRFDDAIATADRAIEIARQTGRDEMLSGITSHRGLYEKKQPYRRQSISRATNGH